MLEKICSRGDTGASRAAWRAAVAFGIPTGGWLPDGYLTDDGAHPEFAEQYGASELPADSELSISERERQRLRRDPLVWPDDHRGRS